ncbi:MAG: SGNH/GDSL hydrolase family protein [Pelagibacteraceae bacterium]|jgi:lysophospholipase L1-like esterase|nr:SGNH/GDSL hydrolase family protein [Pelagibacteraceae bacterium]MCI5078882.1 SGNH/GDSL hydrolase family protein [Pelagibacteraceae bacterium]
MKKIFFINFISVILIILLFELLFGYWFDENNFGIYARKNRDRNEFYNVEYSKYKKKVIYKRNTYGFREDTNIEPKDIKIIFLGGSTGNERFKNYNDTIVGQLNKKNTFHKIINASVDGKTTNGYINDFIFWFPKLKNFSPEVYIAYVGINDSNYNQPLKHDLLKKNKLIFQIRDLISNNSIIIELCKKIIFFYKSFTDHYKFRYNANPDLYKNFKYLSYEQAIKKYDESILKKKYNLLIQRYLERLNQLNQIIRNNNARLILITQIRFNGLNEQLFVINETTKEYAKHNKIDIIKLDEIITMEVDDFYDEVHTTPKGSEKIAEKVFSKLLKIL